MSLADEIAGLRDRVLADLNAAHDYYTNTKIAWALVLQAVKAGRTFRVRNQTTGTVTTQIDLAARARDYVSEQLTEATFQQFVAIFENFVFDLMRPWLMAYPESLREKSLEFKTVPEAPDKDAITLLVVSRELGQIMCDRPQ